MIETREATLDDWPPLRRLVGRIRNHPRLQKILAITEEEMQSAVINSLTPHLPYRLQLVTLFEEVIGFAVICLHQGSSVYAVGTGPGPIQCFIHTMYVEPGTGPDTGRVLVEAIDDWARSGNASTVYGNVRLDGPIKGAARKYGFRPMYTAVGKVL